MILRFSYLLIALALSGKLAAAAPQFLELRQGDHICLVGNTLAERMQHHNHWETLLHARFPRHELVVRNLAWPADEVALRPRADSFGSPEDHLAANKANVIIGFFGFNEAFGGAAGLPQFKKDLASWVEATLKSDFSGRGTPRLALVSPIAHENLLDPHLPDGTAHNRNLELYTAAMREIAGQYGIVFADVFSPTRALFRGDAGPYTINGVHLSERGDAVFAPILDGALFGPGESRPINEGLRAAIADKNFHWYHHYRIVDSYYVYGGRSGLKFADGDQTNGDVLGRERESLDVRTKNRDARIWKLAHDGQAPSSIDDSNAPPFLSVATSFGVNISSDAGANTGQTSKTAEANSARILSSAESLSRFRLASGYAINLFASEEQYPEIGNAVATAFDARGRLWVATMPSYPQWRPGDPMSDKLIILTDTDGDGRADESKVFADRLHLPISFEFAMGGVLVSQQRELLLLRDTDGDDRADTQEILLSGFDSADSHHALNTFTFDPAGALYFQEGTFHHTQVETPYGPVRCKNAGTYRFEPLSQKLDLFVSYSFANPHGIAFDGWGQSFVSDSSPGSNYFATAFSGYLPYPEKHATMQQWFPKRVRPTCGIEFVASRHFPDDAQGDLLLNNVIGVQGVLRHKVRAEGSGYRGEEIEPLVLSDDPNFRPVDLEFGPDGALYITDWQDALIGHMQYSVRDPLRDRAHARIWRVTYPNRPLVSPARIEGAATVDLLDLLKLPEDRTRIRAKQELARRPAAEVVSALARWIEHLDAQDPAIAHHKLEALWVYQWLDTPAPGLLKELLRSPEPRARAAATRTLCYWRDRMPEALDLLLIQAKDEAPLVRLEAVRAASFFTGSKALAVALEILNHDMDYYLQYTLEETMRALRPAPADVADPRALAFVLGRMTNAELVSAVDSESVLVARVDRAGLDATVREEALAKLAKLRGTSREAQIVAGLSRLEERQQDSVAIEELGRLLANSRRDALSPLAETIRRMSGRDTGLVSVRRAAMAARVALEDSVDAVWAMTELSTDSRAALLDSIGLLADVWLRSKFQPYIRSLFADSKATLAPNVRSAAMRCLPLLGEQHAAENFALLAAQFQLGAERATAARALRALPRASWNDSDAGPLARAIVSYSQTVPTNQRSTQDFVEIVQLGAELAERVPEPEGKRLRKSLRDVSVSVFVIKTLREQMRFDVAQIVVEPGKPFEIIFENTDIMPHNLVVVTEGAREEIGLAAQVMPATPDKAGRLYVPTSEKVLAATRMLEPGQRETLRLVAPLDSKELQFVCTFPGHWSIMWGRVLVTTEPESAVQPPSVSAVPQHAAH